MDEVSSFKSAPGYNRLDDRSPAASNLRAEVNCPAVPIYWGIDGKCTQSLHTYVDPGVRPLMTLTIAETAEDEREGDASDPKKHFEDQIRRIQRGEEIEHLTIR